jgi:fatty acid desaturase
MQTRTPITQALADGALTRRELKALMARSDRPALARLALWIAALGATGSLVWLALGTVWVWPAMFVHGVLLVHHFSLQHECVHYTAFRTRWLNDVVGRICGTIILLPHSFFRYEHCDHHTWTQLKGRDPELIELPISLGRYLWYVSSIPYWRAKLAELARHVRGRLSETERRFIPRGEEGRVFREARIMAAIHGGVLAYALATGWGAPFWFWWGPVLLGEPVMRAIRLTEHVGRPNVDDLKENTRTNLVGPVTRFLCWNMNYHAEHHYAASVPFHALPKLHEKLRGYVHVEERGYLGAHRDILAQLTGRKPRSDAAA